MRVLIQSKNIIPKVFLYSMALQPLVALLWQQRLFFFKLNWLLYPIIMAAVIFSIAWRRRAPGVFYALIIVFFLYGIYFLGMPTDWDTIFRIFISLLPLTFIGIIQKTEDKSIYRTFWILFFISILAPLVISYLQYTERFPYFEFDVDETGQIGRISGGYNKPNNLVAFLFPLYLFGFYQWKIRRRQLLGWSLIIFVLTVVYFTGLRTAVAIFALVVLCSYFGRTTSNLIYDYYRYYLNFFFGVFAFIGLYFFFHKYGIVDGIRGRIPMWLAHAETFFTSSWTEILTGKGRVLLGKEYENVKLVGSLDEAHNNTFRTIVVFGLIGYFLYCTFVRWLVKLVYLRDEDPNLKFIRLSCFLFLLLYSITNEPAYYSGILWSALLGIFPVWKVDAPTDPIQNG